MTWPPTGRGGAVEPASPPQTSAAPSSPAPSLQDALEQVIMLAMFDLGCSAPDAVQFLADVFTKVAAVQPPTMH